MKLLMENWRKYLNERKTDQIYIYDANHTINSYIFMLSEP